MGLSIDIQKVREIHKNSMRVARQPILESLDIEYMRSIESGDTAKQLEIANKKQELRDCTCLCDTYEITSNSILGVTEEMKQCWDSCLGDNPLI